MTGKPPVTPVSMGPVTRDPNPTRMRGEGPATADGDISTVAPFPVFVDPYVRRAGSDRAYHCMPFRSYGDIHLSRSRIGDRTCRNQQDRKECKPYNFTFHMLVFKLTKLINAILQPNLITKSTYFYLCIHLLALHLRNHLFGNVIRRRRIV